MLVDPDDLHAVEAVRVVDEPAGALGQHRIIGGGPVHAQGCGDPRDRQMIEYQALQCPGQPTPRQFRPRLGGSTGVLAPYPPAAGAPVPAHPHSQDRGPVPERSMGQAPDHRVTRDPLASAPVAPLVGLDDPAGQDRLLGTDQLTGDLQTEFIETGKCGQVRSAEGSVVHGGPCDSRGQI